MIKKLLSLNTGKKNWRSYFIPHTSYTARRRGFTLLETIFYTAGLLILLAVIITFIYFMFDWYQRVTIAPRADRIGVGLVQRITKDLRSGTHVNSAQSFFGVSNGALSFDANVNSGSVTKYFVWGANRLIYQENGGTITYISPSDINISRFLVNSTTTPQSQGIRFDIDITYTSRATGSVTKTYSGFAILRQSYE